MSSDLVLASDQSAFTQNQVAVLKQLGVQSASAGDLAIFFHQCKRTGLDPFTKQIYMIGRGGKQTIQVGIDGCRLIADRTGAYLGSDETWQEDANGKLVSATVTVRKLVGGQVGNFVAVARLDEYQSEYNGKPQGLWTKMPHRMLAKCAEALALRKAFPQDLSGLYTTEEMSQSDTPVQQVEATVTVVDPDPLVSPENVERFKQACANAMLDPETVAKDAGVGTDVQMRESHRIKLLASFQKLKAAIPPGTVFGNLDLAKEITDDIANPIPNVTPLLASTKQLAAVRALLRGSGIMSTADQLAAISHGVGRIVESLSELTPADATHLLTVIGKGV